MEHEGVTSGNRVHWTVRALEGLRTNRKTKSSSPLRGIRAGLGMRFMFASKHKVLEFKPQHYQKKNIEEQ